MFKPLLAAAFAVTFCALFTGPLLLAQPLVQNGESIAFMGDSITQQGTNAPTGYVRLVESGLAANGIKIKVIGAGISGNKSNDMLARIDGVVSQSPTWMTLSCGVNDVWHSNKNNGIPLEDYKANITAIVDRAQAANIKVMILTATLIGPDAEDPLNLMAVDYNNFLRDFAHERQLPLADLNALMLQEQPSSAKSGKETALTVDGVHMNVRGNRMMARGVLRAFGLDDAQMAKAEFAWQDLKVGAQVNLPLTMKQMDELQLILAAEKKNLNELSYEIISAYLAERSAATPSAAEAK